MASFDGDVSCETEPAPPLKESPPRPQREQLGPRRPGGQDLRPRVLAARGEQAQNHPVEAAPSGSVQTWCHANRRRCRVRALEAT